MSRNRIAHQKRMRTVAALVASALRLGASERAFARESRVGERRADRLPLGARRRLCGGVSVRDRDGSYPEARAPVRAARLGCLVHLHQHRRPLDHSCARPSDSSITFFCAIKYNRTIHSSRTVLYHIDFSSYHSSSYSITIFSLIKSEECSDNYSEQRRDVAKEDMEEEGLLKMQVRVGSHNYAYCKYSTFTARCSILLPFNYW